MIGNLILVKNPIDRDVRKERGNKTLICSFCFRIGKLYFYLLKTFFYCTCTCRRQTSKQCTLYILDIAGYSGMQGQNAISQINSVPASTAANSLHVRHILRRKKLVAQSKLSKQPRPQLHALKQHEQPNGNPVQNYQKLRAQGQLTSAINSQPQMQPATADEHRFKVSAPASVAPVSPNQKQPQNQVKEEHSASEEAPFVDEHKQSPIQPVKPPPTRAHEKPPAQQPEVPPKHSHPPNYHHISGDDDANSRFFTSHF